MEKNVGNTPLFTLNIPFRFILLRESNINTYNTWRTLHIYIIRGRKFDAGSTLLNIIYIVIININNNFSIVYIILIDTTSYWYIVNVIDIHIGYQQIENCHHFYFVTKEI